MPSELETGAPDVAELRAEVAHARKLGFAILTVLQDRGVLSAQDVEAILLAARRSVKQDPSADLGVTRASVTSGNAQPSELPEINFEW